MKLSRICSMASLGMILATSAVHAAPAGVFTIRLVPSAPNGLGGACLGVSSPNAGEKVLPQPCNPNNASQQWVANQVGTAEWGWSVYTFMNRGTGKCMDASISFGGPLLQWDCHGGENQKIAINPNVFNASVSPKKFANLISQYKVRHPFANEMVKPCFMAKVDNGVPNVTMQLCDGNGFVEGFETYTVPGAQ